MAKAPSEKLTFKHKFGYFCGDCGGMFSMVMVANFMNRYVTNVLQINPAVLATLLLIWNAWDMINDPLMGTLMDISFAKAKNKANKFRPWVLRSIPMMVIGLIAFYTVPSMLGGVGSIIALFLLKIVYELGYTMCNIAMGSLLGVMSTNDGERAALASARGMGSTVGGLIVMMVIPKILAALGETATGYGVAATVCAILCGIVVFCHYFFTEERNVAAQNATVEKEEKIKFTDILNVFAKNRAYLALCLHSICIVFGTQLYNQTSSYMYADYFGDIGIMGMNTLVSMGLTFVLLSISPVLAKKLGLTNVIRGGLLIGIGGFAALFFTIGAVKIPAIVYLLWSGVSYALINLSVQMQWGLVGESIDYNEYLTGKRSEGSIYGVFSLTRRLGQMLSQSLVVLMISWVGYDTAAANAGLAQTAEVLSGIKSLNLLGPIIGAVGSFLCFTFLWNINDDVRAKMKAWKESRAAKAE